MDSLTLQEKSSLFQLEERKCNHEDFCGFTHLHAIEEIATGEHGTRIQREKKAIITEGESPERHRLLLVEQAVPRLVLPLIVLCSRQVFRCASQPSTRQCLRILGFSMFKNPNQTQMAINKQKNQKSILLCL